MNTQTGKFLAKVTVFGGSLDKQGNIISRDTNGLPAVWLSPLAGSIPNRNTLTGSVAQRAGIRMDSDGVIGRGENHGTSFSFRLIFGQYNLTGQNDNYGPQYAFTILQDLTDAPNVAKEIVELETMLGQGTIFEVPKPALPADYQKKTNQHVSARRLDPAFHSTLSQSNSNPVNKALNDLGPQRSDVKGGGEGADIIGSQSTENLANPAVNITGRQ